MKKYLAILIMSFIFIYSQGTGAIAAESESIPNVTYSDIKGHWAENQIKSAIAEGYVAGYSDGTFKPDAMISGEDFLTMIIKALHIQVEATHVGESWFSPYKQAAINNNLYKDDYKSSLDKPITRGEISSTLVRATQDSVYKIIVKEKMTNRYESMNTSYASIKDDKKAIEASPYFKGEFILDPGNPDLTVAQLKQLLLEIPEPIHTGSWTEEDFNNVAARSSAKSVLNFINYTLDPIKKMNEDQTSPNRIIYEATLRGLITGDGKGELSLNNKVTRAQAVIFINRVLKFNSGERFEINKYDLGTAEILWHKTNILTMLPRYFANSSTELDTSMMTSKTTNGNIVSSVTKILVVDLDDAKDPNKKLLDSSNLMVINGGRYHNLSEYGGYAVVGFAEVEIKGDTIPKEVFATTIQITNNDWYKLPDSRKPQKNPNKAYGIMQWDDSYPQPKIRLKSDDFSGKKATYIRGTLIPKGNFTSNKDFALGFYTLPGSGGSEAYSLLRSTLNTKYNQ